MAQFMISLVALLVTTAAWAVDKSPARFDEAIARFEQQDKDSPPPANPIVFVGSSTTQLWKLKRGFADLPCLNRGYSGSHIADSVHFADRIVIPYRPRVVVVGAGGNDIASGKTPEQVCEDFKALVRKIHAALPQTKIFYVSLYPSVASAKIDDKLCEVNARIEAFSRTDARLGYIDTRTRMTSPDGGPRPELFREDKLHMNDQGYAIWDEIAGPIVHAAYAKGAAANARP
jgi:lysophospholipase L1-like esterase